MLKSLTISQLAERCRAETERYKHTKHSNDAYCLELFRRALSEQNENDWQALYAQYQPLVLTWVHRYSRFPQTNEAADFFVNDAFARLWQFGANPETVEKLDALGKCISYLKSCVGSAIENYMRKKEKDALNMAVFLEDYDRPLPASQNQTAIILSVSALKQTLRETVQNEAERLVAEESWVYGLAPRQIQAAHPETFATTEIVSRVKLNLLKRLRRRLKKETGDEWFKD